MSATVPVRKGQRTREEIVRQAAAVFNVRGFSGASMSEIMAATGLEKGGLYNHFASKEELALAALDYANAQQEARFRELTNRGTTRLEHLLGAVAAFAETLATLEIPGGCPVMRMAIEPQSALRDRSRAIMARWRSGYAYLVRKAIEAGQLDPAIEPDALGSMIVATMEGAMLLGQMEDSREPLDRAAAFLREYVLARSIA